MRVPPFERYRGFTRSAGIFLLGAVVGAALFNSIYHTHLNELHRSIDGLNTVIEEKERDIKQLNDYKNDHNMVIKTVHVYIENSRETRTNSIELDTRTELELKKAVARDFDIFLGRRVYEIGADSRLARTLLNRKIYTIGLDKKYQIQVLTMLVVDTSLTVWVSAKMQAVL
ncbi:hypothetical protein [Paenibacillus sp. SYP-B4298]|uniref:hypothetical protein n=1 Tax=Paenibacillus sp. SYP-B4298 TaxID=2996034 RepID=UPI0022DE6B56|nr:hypothetical protein [Paenibacillus sp. SYP-B4298]